jgi:CubicO group peptidase (beta-lactamase class C family)
MMTGIKHLSRKLALSMFFLCTGTPVLKAQIRTAAGSGIKNEVFEQFVKSEMDSLGMPALSVAVISGNKIVYHRALGLADMSTKKPVDTASLFEVASMSKTAFSYFVMKEVEKGTLCLDTPLYKYMPYPDISKDDRYKLITARMVLCHTTGFPNWRYFDPGDSAKHIPPGTLYLKFTPGTSFGYSGEGYQYLAAVIAHLHHLDLRTLDQLFQKEVAQPLGLKHFTFAGSPYILQHKVSGHENGKVAASENGKSAGHPWVQAFMGQDSMFFVAGGSLHTEAVAYARFLIDLMEHKGISQTSLDEILKSQIQLPEEYKPDTAWGLGIAIRPTRYGLSYEHGGNNGDFQSGFQYFKAQKMGYVFITNCDKGAEFFQRISRYLTFGY